MRAVEHADLPAGPRLAGRPLDRVVTVLALAPAVVPHQRELALGGVTAAHVLRHDGVSVPRVVLAVSPGPPDELVGDPLDQDRIPTGRGRPPDHRVEQGAVAHRDLDARLFDDLVSM